MTWAKKPKNNKKQPKQTKPFSNREEKLIREIVKFDATRKYFGNWSPRELNESYQNAPQKLNIGVLSVDDICNALWHEMSYNPIRFGYKSPFVFDGKNSLDGFIDTRLDLANDGFETLSGIQAYLSRFLRKAHRYDINFWKNGFLKDTSLMITTVYPSGANGNPIPNEAYIMLDFLRRSIKLIAMQNLDDFKHAKYRNTIAKVVMARHEQIDINERNGEPISKLIRPIKITNFDEMQTKLNDVLFMSEYEEAENFIKTKIVGDREKLSEYRKDKKRLEKELAAKADEILETESRIEELSEYEEPGDLSAEQSNLKQQQEQEKAIRKSLEHVDALIYSATHPRPRN